MCQCDDILLVLGSAISEVKQNRKLKVFVETFAFDQRIKISSPRQEDHLFSLFPLSHQKTFNLSLLTCSPLF